MELRRIENMQDGDYFKMVNTIKVYGMDNCSVYMLSFPPPIEDYGKRYAIPVTAQGGTMTFTIPLDFEVCYFIPTRKELILYLPFTI